MASFFLFLEMRLRRKRTAASGEGGWRVKSSISVRVVGLFRKGRSFFSSLYIPFIVKLLIIKKD